MATFTPLLGIAYTTSMLPRNLQNKFGTLLRTNKIHISLSNKVHISSLCSISMNIPWKINDLPFIKSMIVVSKLRNWMLTFLISSHWIVVFRLRNWMLTFLKSFLWGALFQNFLYLGIITQEVDAYYRRS